MPANNRIFYATQAVALLPQNADGTSLYSTSWYLPKGLQSVGITTNFALEQVFQLGQIELYDQTEDVPEVEVTMNKVLDGTAPLYLLCMGGSAGIAGANGKELPAVANNRVNFRLGIFADSNSAATGTPQNFVDCSGMYLSSVSYAFPVDGNATEDVTLVGNNKYWNSGSLFATSTAMYSTGSGSSPSTVRRYSLDFSSGNTILPTGAGGIPIPSGRTEQRPYLQNISISTDLGREAVNELGRMAPYFRYVNFPVEVTSEFEVVAADGDQIDASDFSDKSGCGQSYKNLTEKPIKINICGSGAGDSLTIDLGSKNKLTSVNYTGGDSGGGNATITYSFQSFNKFVVSASGTYAAANYVDTTDDVSILD
jgi:hypothetical protein